MECVVRKLKATIDNASLPEFQNVVLKNYITTTEDGQYIELSDIYYTLNNVKMEGVFECTVGNITKPIFGTETNCLIMRRNQYVRAKNTTEGNVVVLNNNTECHAGYDSSDTSFFIDETTGNCSSPVQYSQRANFAKVFAAPAELNSVSGAFKIKQIKITDTAYNRVYTLVPAEVNGVACLYDVDRGTIYGEANGGTLLCG